MGLLSLYFLFFKIGIFTIGGGLAMLPLMQKELVAGGMMTLQETVDMVAISQMTPGPFAVNAATFAGMRLHGFAGAAAATLGVVTPSVILTALVAKFLITFAQKPMVKGVLSGVRPAVTGLILSAALGVAFEAFFPGGWGASADWQAMTLAALAMAAMFAVRRLSPIFVIAVCGGIGAAFLR